VEDRRGILPVKERETNMKIRKIWGKKRPSFGVKGSKGEIVGYSGGRRRYPESGHDPCLDVD